MKFTLEFDMENEIFVNYPEQKIAETLLFIAQNILTGATDGFLLDSSGNKIGAYSWGDEHNSESL